MAIPYDLLQALNTLTGRTDNQEILNRVNALLAPGQYDNYVRADSTQYPMVYSGLVQPGNLDLFNRQILNNPDGSYSTTSSMSFNDGQNEVIIPTVGGVAAGQPIVPMIVQGSPNGDVVRYNDLGAFYRYDNTGQHLGMFNDWRQADDYGQRVHEIQERRIADNNGQPF